MKQRYLQLVRKSFRLLRHKRLRDRPWWKRLTKPLLDRHLWVPCRDTVAAGLAIGMFFSMILVLPFQMLFSAVLAMRFKVNVPFAMAACWVSNIFTVGPLGLAQLRLGEWMIKVLRFPMTEVLERLPFHISDKAPSFLLGMMVSAVLAGLLSYPIVHLFSALMPHHLPVLKRRAAQVSPGEGT